MKKFLSPVVIFLFFVVSSFAQEAIRVDRVDFNTTKEDWIQMEVELSCMGNPSGEGRDKNFVQDINVKVYLAFERDASAREYDYYTSEVDVIIMERGDDNNVYFYLPGLIAERDQLPKDPMFYYVEISVAGEAQAPQRAAMSSSIPNLQILESFISSAESKGEDNEHLLMPIYFVPGDVLGRVSKLPAFLRRDVRD